MIGSRLRAFALGVLVLAPAWPASGAAQTPPSQVAIEAGQLALISLLERPANAVIEPMSLPAALAELSRASGVPLNYSDDLLPRSRIVSCACQRVPVGDALARLLSGTGLRFVEMRSHVLIEPVDNSQAVVTEVALTRGAPVIRLVKPRRPPGGVLQDSVIAGTVVEARSQRPVAGAQVLIEGSAPGTLTDPQGRFRVTAMPGQTVTLRVSMLGYRTLTRQVRVGETGLRLVLETSAIELDQIVVTGTPGGTERRALGNSVSRIDAGSVIDVAPISNVGQLINARAPGVVVQPSTGAVGSGPRIRIRGASSISLFGNEPILYVDGIRVDNRPGTGPGSQLGGFGGIGPAGTGGAVVSRLNDFNPGDIESIEIIKGPAAAALYGTEASAGVIQIITKKGTIGDRPQFGVTLRQGVNWFMDAENRWPTWYSRDPATGQVSEMNLVRTERERGTPVFRTGHTQGYGTTISGGSERFRYYVGADLDREGGIEPTNSAQRFGLRSNLDLAAGDRADLSINLGLSTSEIRLPSESFAGIWLSMNQATPQALDTPQRGFAGGPPEAWWQAMENRGETNRFTAGFRLQYRTADWLTQRVSLGLDLAHDHSYTLTRNVASDPFLSQFSLGLGAGGQLGTKVSRREQAITQTVDYGATATAQLTPSLGSSTSVGFQYYRNFLSFVAAEGRGFPDFSVESISAATTTFSRDDFVENSTVGVYVQQQFGWQNRLFVTGALRADDNSAFGENFDLVTYPKVSASWVASEQGSSSLRFVDALKLRAAYGQSGQQPQAFAAVRTYGAVGGEAGESGLWPSATGNPDLGPERGQEIEVGFEAALFDNRLGLDVTYYRARTTDAILNVPLPLSMGFSDTRFVNAGTLDNRGVEALVQARLIDARSVDWDLTFNFSRNANKVVELADGVEELSVSGLDLRHRVGHPVFSWFARSVVSADIDANGIASNVLCDGGPENNHQPVACAQAPYQFSGSALPKTEGSVSSTVTLFERLRLYGLVDFKRGHKLYDLVYADYCTRGGCPELAFPGEHDPLRVAGIQSLTRGEFATADAGFAKLREVSASYTLPTTWAQSFGASRAAVTVAGRNLHTWTSWTGLDPESYDSFSFGQVTRLFFPRGLTPQLAQFVTTVSLTF